MSKKTNTIKNSVTTDSSWKKGSGFVPSRNGGSSASHKKISSALYSAGELKPLLEKLLENITGAVSAWAGIIRLLSPVGRTPMLVTSVGLPAELLEEEGKQKLQCESCHKVSVGYGIYSADLGACKSQPDCRYASCQMGSLITIPIESHAAPKKTIGELTLFFREPQVSSEQTSKTFLGYAQMLGMIIEYNKSIRDARRIDLIAERQAIANEIHDSLAQSLVYTRMRTSMLIESIRTGNELMSAKYAHDVDEALENSQKTVRELITDFRCSMDPLGLLHALQSLIDQFCQRSGITLEYINHIANLELPLEHEIQVYHIVQEALANIATHSGAANARLIMEFSGNNYVFTIEDFGSGCCTFTPVEGHYGMMIMRERAQRIGGEIKVESSQGFGTRVQLYFPEPGSDWRDVNE